MKYSKKLMYLHMCLENYQNKSPYDVTVFSRIAYVRFSFRYGNVLMCYDAFIYKRSKFL